MDKLHEEKLREEFEILYMKHHPESSVSFNTAVGRYKYAFAQAQYEFFCDTWKAVRAGIVVELPEITEQIIPGEYHEGEASGYESAIEACKESLRSIGLSIKGE